MPDRQPRAQDRPLARPFSITSSARNKSDSGIFNPERAAICQKPTLVYQSFRRTYQLEVHLHLAARWVALTDTDRIPGGWRGIETSAVPLSVSLRTPIFIVPEWVIGMAWSHVEQRSCDILSVVKHTDPWQRLVELKWQRKTDLGWVDFLTGIGAILMVTATGELRHQDAEGTIGDNLPGW